MQPQLLLGPLFIWVKNVGIIQGNKQKEITDIIEKNLNKDARTHMILWDQSYQCEKKGTTQYYTQT